MNIRKPSASQPIKLASILIGSGDQTYGVVSLSASSTIEIAGDTWRITRMLARLRRLPAYRGLPTEEFVAALPEAACDGCHWATPLDAEVIDQTLDQQETPIESR
jgi:hypothetical protein